ncbi:unnamed protein product, partial [Rotaria magnacalcarata]
NNNNNNNNIENDTTLLTTTTTTTTTTVEFKVKTTKTSSRKRKSNIINDTNNDITKEQAISKKKQNHNRDHQLPSTYESSERILRNGKRRGSATTVIGNATTKMNSFKMPDVPPTKNDNQIKMNVTEDEINSMSDDKSHMKNLHNPDDEVADSYSSSRSISPTTSGTSTTSSSPLLSNNIENQSASLPMDLSNSKINVNIEQNTSNSMVQPYHFSNDMLFPLSTTSDYFSSLENSANPLGLPSFNKLSPTTSSPSSYHSIPAQIYLNSSSTL